MHNPCCFIALTASVLSQLVANGTPIINEFMAVNRSTLADTDGKWVFPKGAPD